MIWTLTMSSGSSVPRQLPMFDIPDRLDRIVNVASVRQLSPFRYPGGKTWLIPRIRAWLEKFPRSPSLFVEPFAGGGIVSLTVAAEDLAEHVWMVELDMDVAALWETVLGDDAEWLANEVRDFHLTRDNVQHLIGREPATRCERAMTTLVKNRTLHGGILAPGSGLVKHGENGKGLSSRWYPVTLRRRILAIAQMKDRITFECGDGVDAMKRERANARAAFFIDPPYTAGGKRAGRRLYKHSEIDHQELFCVAASLAGDFLMTYDNTPEIQYMAREHRFDTLLVSMQNTHLATMQELLVGRDLSWATP
jgi:DNA adenine methylase